jgi:hypothetical protein
VSRHKGIDYIRNEVAAILGFMPGDATYNAAYSQSNFRDHCSNMQARIESIARHC